MLPSAALRAQVVNTTRLARDGAMYAAPVRVRTTYSGTAVAAWLFVIPCPVRPRLVLGGAPAGDGNALVRGTETVCLTPPKYPVQRKDEMGMNSGLCEMKQRKLVINNCNQEHTQYLLQLLG